MKFICTIGFLIASSASIFLGLKFSKSAINSIRLGKTALLKSIAVSSSVLVLYFIQFWLLSQTPFPFYILLILIAASLFTLPVYEFIGAVAGFTLKEKRDKINKLYTIVAFQQSLNNPGKAKIMQLSGILILIGWLAALVIFWLQPLSSPEVRIWTAVFIFIVPQISNIINSLNSVTPIVASQFVDDDLRNANLASNFSSVSYSLIFFIFPFYILKQEFAFKFTWLPPYWVLISIPLILFFLLAIIPFFVGLYKHQNQKKYFLEWEKDWLDDFKNTLYLPAGGNKTTVEEEKMSVLQKEISARSTEDKINDLFTGLQDFRAVNPDNLSEAEEMLLLVKENERNIKKWNLQLSYISKLEETRDAVYNLKSDKDALKEYIENNMKEISEDIEGIKKSKNLLGGVLTAALTALISFAFKTYQADILKLLGNFYQ